MAAADAVKVSYGRRLPMAQRRAAAELYWQAFGTKLGRVLGPGPKALAYIERVLAPDHAFLALSEAGEVLGLIGFRTARGSFVAGGPDDLRAIYGRFGALWRRGAMALLPHEQIVEGVVVDGLVVRPDMRGKGLGAALLETLCLEAQARGHAAVRLDVVEENLRARALYERLGFAVHGRRRHRLTRLLFDFGGVWVMVRRF
jgi:ribosomal protein S18 acetylase RimI-like enzyme